MSRKTISRRNALGIIGKTGISLVSGTYFFLSLKTSPLAGAPKVTPVPGQGQVTAQRLKVAPQIAEKVGVSGSGSTLVFKISGPAGRHFGVSFAMTDTREHYKFVANSRGLIGENGLAIIEVDVRGLPNGKVFLRVVTGNTNSFGGDIAGTEAFVVQVSKGAIAGYEGLLNRPMEHAKNATVAMAAAACGTQK